MNNTTKILTDDAELESNNEHFLQPFADVYEEITPQEQTFLGNNLLGAFQPEAVPHEGDFIADIASMAAGSVSENPLATDITETSMAYVRTLVGFFSGDPLAVFLELANMLLERMRTNAILNSLQRRNIIPAGFFSF